MGKIRKFVSYILFVFISVVLCNTVVDAAPSTGGITCTYTLPYMSWAYENYNATLKYVVENGKLKKSGGEWSCPDDDKNSPCRYMNDRNITTYVNDITHVDNFYSNSSEKWQCPKISYAIYHGGISMWLIFVGPEGEYGGQDPDLTAEEAEKRNSILGKATNVKQPSKEEEEEIKESVKNCTAYKSNYNGVPYALEINKKTFLAKVTIGGQYVHDLQLTSATCPTVGSLTHCKNTLLPANDYSEDRIVYGESCYEWALENNIAAPEIYQNYNTSQGESTTTDADNEIVDKTGPSGDTSVNVDDTTDFGTAVNATCEDILGDVIDIIQDIFDIAKIAAPILLILFGSLDFGKAVVANDDKQLKKATSDFIKRAIAAVALFFLPLLITLVLDLPGLELGLEDALCGVSKVVIRW